MKKMLLISSALAMIGIAQVAEASITTYKVTETFLEPETQPSDSIFIGTFDFDNVSKTVSNLKGLLSESMSGSGENAYPNDDMTWLSLNYQLSAVYDSTLGGLLVTTFLNNSTNTFTNSSKVWQNWLPGVATKYYGSPDNTPANAYAMIFVNTTDPLAPLTQAQINKLAYADCTAGGMMGQTCMTGTTVAGYGRLGTMSGFPVSQTITLAAAPVPEPETYAMLMAGLGLMGLVARKRRKNG